MSVRFFGRLLHLPLLFVACLSLSAAPPITVTAAYPDAIIVNIPTIVTIKAQVGNDPSLISNSVNLIRLTAQGQALGVIGSLYDDGTHGDTFGGDGVFTGQFSFTETQLGSVSLATTAAYRGSLLRVRSTILTLAVIQDLIDIPNISQTQSQAASLYHSLAGQIGPSSARTAVVSSLLQQAGVVAARLAADQRTIVIQYADGIRGMLMTSSEGTSGGRVPQRRRGPVASKLPLCPLPAVSVTGPLPGVIVLAPFYDQFGVYDGSGKIANDFVNTCASPVGQPIVNEDVTIELLGTLTRYSIIAIYTHGGTGWGKNRDEVGLATRLPFNTVNQRKYADDFSNFRLQPCSVDGTPGIFICATASFFQNRASVEKFPGSIVFANGCQTVGTTAGGVNYTLRDAFLENGASTYLGWKDSVSINFNGPTEQAYFDLLTNVSLPLSQRTTKWAYDHLMGTVDPTQQEGYFAALYLFGNYDRTICNTGASFTISSGGPSAMDAQPLFVALSPVTVNASITLTTNSGGDLTLDGFPLFSVAPKGSYVFQAGIGTHTVALRFRGVQVQSVVTVSSGVPSEPILGTAIPLAPVAELAVASSQFISQQFVLTGSVNIDKIAVEMSGFGSDLFTIWVTDSIGPTTTPANVLFRSNLTFANTGGGVVGGATVSAMTNLFIGPGTYYVVLSSAQQSSLQGVIATSTTLASSIGSVGTIGATCCAAGATNSAFPPASTFRDTGPGYIVFQIFGQ